MALLDNLKDGVTLNHAVTFDAVGAAYLAAAAIVAALVIILLQKLING